MKNVCLLFLDSSFAQFAFNVTQSVTDTQMLILGVMHSCRIWVLRAVLNSVIESSLQMGGTSIAEQKALAPNMLRLIVNC